MTEEAELCFPQLHNSSCKKLKRSGSESVLVFFTLCFISLITLSLNLLVIISISHFKQLHTSTNYFILSLAVSDFLVGFLFVFQIMLADGCWYLGDHMCVFYWALDIIITFISVVNMVLISVDRYVAICDPLHYSSKVTPKRVQICVLLCWTCSLFYAIVLLRKNLKQPGKFKSCSGECVNEFGFIEQIASLILTFILPITVIIVLYVRVFVVVVSQVQTMRSHVAAVEHQRSRKITAKKSEMKAARTLGVVVLVFLMCLCPFYGVRLSNQNAHLNNLSVLFVICLFYFNSCLNPLIYVFFYPWFRKTIKIIVTLQVIKSSSSDTIIM